MGIVKYGNAWESYPMEKEKWGITVDGELRGLLKVHDVYNELPSFMKSADLVFIDPPYNQSAYNAYQTKAGLNGYIDDFVKYQNRLMECIDEISPDTLYVESPKGKEHKVWLNLMNERYEHIQIWHCKYYKSGDCYIIRASNKGEIDFDYTGMDEEDVVFKLCEIEDYHCIGDLNMGMGLVALASFKVGKMFVGTEINKRRIANSWKSIMKHVKKSRFLPNIEIGEIK